jgi:hypothetical protein
MVHGRMTSVMGWTCVAPYGSGCLGPGRSGGGGPSFATRSSSSSIFFLLRKPKQGRADQHRRWRPAQHRCLCPGRLLWRAWLELIHVDDDTCTLRCYVSVAPSRLSFQLWPPPLWFPVQMDSNEALVHGEPGPAVAGLTWSQVPIYSLDFLHLLVLIDLELYMCSLTMDLLEFCLFCLWVPR